VGFIWIDQWILVSESGDLQLCILQSFNIREFVADYVKSCTTCARSKAKQHKPYGLLCQLPVLLHPWESISIDFIEQFPDSEGFTAILVVVDHCTKQALFILTHDTITSAQLAELFIIHVFSKHRVLSHVTSDQGSKFVSCFFRSLGKALNMKLHFTLGYHPEGDGQMERVNQTLEQYVTTSNNVSELSLYSRSVLSEVLLSTVVD
jgi:hypothetical protein